MNPEINFGLRCAPKDEKAIIQRVNAYLATMNRTTSKAKQKSLLDARSPYVLKHFYWNLNKAVGTWVEIHPNKDERGVLFFPRHPELSWIVRVRFNDPVLRHEADLFVRGLLAATGFEHEPLQGEPGGGEAS